MPSTPTAPTPRVVWLVWPVLGCLCCALVIAHLTVQARAGVQHFEYAISISLWAGMVLSCLMGLWCGLRKAASRRRRFRRLGLLLSIVPILVWISIIGKAVVNRLQWEAPNDPLSKLSVQATATLMQAELAWRYPKRLEGPRIVLFHHGEPHAQAALSRMESFLEKLENQFQRKIETPIHWAKGRLLGHGALSTYGLIVSVEPVRVTTTPEGRQEIFLSGVDTHEAAHAAMSQWQPSDIDPPIVLVEGWAEACVAYGGLPAWRQRFLELERAGTLPPRGQILAHFFDHENYYQYDERVYPIGGFLTQYLIDQFGHEKFIELYRDIRPDTVEEKFGDIYAQSVDEIEKAMLEGMPAETQ